MLIKQSPDAYDKLRILGGMASDDILSPPERRGDRGGPYPSAKKNPTYGVYRASMPNGKFINLMRVMFTDFCKMDCAYCPNSHWVPRKRYAFKVDELARTFMELTATADRQRTLPQLRHRRRRLQDHRAPGQGGRCRPQQVRLQGLHPHEGDARRRVRVRRGRPPARNPAVGQHRDPHQAAHGQAQRYEGFPEGHPRPDGWIHKLTEESTGGAVGQATQLVVGAADETDRDIFGRIDQLYTEWKLKRVYYAPFRPVRYTPLEEHPATPMTRSHRLYQMDWLKRVYKFSNDEIDLAFGDDDHLPLDLDPKTSIAVENLDAFPMDINNVSYETLLRIPGVGPKSAQRIVQNRRAHTIDTWRDLQTMGVVRKWAWPFLTFPGHRPPRAKQLRLDLFGEDARERRREQTPEPADSDGPLRRGEIVRRMPHVRNARTPRRPRRRTQRHPSASRRVNFTRPVLYHWQGKSPLSLDGLTGVGKSVQTSMSTNQQAPSPSGRGLG